MKPKSQALIYTILADDKPVAALEASGSEARELLSEQWFLHELSTLKVDGEPIYKAGPGYEPGRPLKTSGPYTTKSARQPKMRTRFCSFI